MAALRLSVMLGIYFYSDPNYSVAACAVETRKTFLRFHGSIGSRGVKGAAAVRDWNRWGKKF